MNKNNSKLPDELFSEGFISHEAEFDPAAWEQMERLLDEEDRQPAVIVPEHKQQHHTNNLLIITIMTTLSIFSIATWMLFSGASTEDGTTTPVRGSSGNYSGIFGKTERQTGTNSTNTTIKSGQNSLGEALKNESITTGHYFSKPGIRKYTGKNNTGYLKKQVDATDRDSSGKPAPYLDSIRTVTTDGKTYKVLIRKIWVPEEYQYVDLPREKVIRDFWIGMHFTSQRLLKSDSNNSAGFNIQFMSGNRLPNKHWAIYGGFDFGMQFYNRGKKSNVVLNNTSQDSGFTRLRTHSMDFIGRAHLEYARFALVPYVNLMAGPRLYSTAQTVESYLHMKETESRTSHNAHSSVSMIYGVGLGARLRLSPVISLDARYELISGSPVKIADLENSSFNGLNYDLKLNKVRPTSEQFKIGIIFDLSEGDYEKKMVKEGYYKEYSYDSLYMDPKDSGKVYLPCNCAPCPTATEQHSRPYEDTEVRIPGGGGNSGSNRNNSGSGSRQKPFPGIKPPARTTERN